MKIALVALMGILSFSAFSMSITTDWTQDSRKVLELSCSQEEVTCDKICGKNSCKVQEQVCVDCVGTSIAMTYAFQEMGRILHNSGVKADAYFVSDLILSGRFVTLSSRSLYNLVDRFDSISLRRKFGSLCEDRTRYPTVFFKKLRSGKLGEVQAVHCNDGIFLMSDEAQVIGGNKGLF